MKLPEMTIERAEEINHRIVYAYLAVTGTVDVELPGLADVTFAEAVVASETIRARGPVRNAAGTGTTLTCTVDVSRLPRLAHLFQDPQP